MTKNMDNESQLDRYAPLGLRLAVSNLVVAKHLGLFIMYNIVIDGLHVLHVRVFLFVHCN